MYEITKFKERDGKNPKGQKVKEFLAWEAG